MTFQVMFEIEGKPFGKGRPRFARRGKFVSTYTDAKTKSYETTIRDAAKAAMGSSEPLETAVAVYLYIRYPVPAAYSKKRSKDCLEGIERPTKKPDWDNVAKAICDSLNNIVYKDDCQIVDAHVTKVYADDAGVDVLVKEV